MFLPDTRLNKLLQKDKGNYSNYAYIYNDGIGLFIEDINNARKFLHLIPCEISIHYSNRRDKSKTLKFEGRILLRNTSLLINGIKSIEIFQDNISTNMTILGITGDLVTIITKDNMVIRLGIFSFCINDTQYNENDEINTIDKLYHNKYLTDYEIIFYPAKS